MKIALFSHVTYPFTNGVAVSVEQLARTLRNKGHEVTIITNNYKKFSNDFSNSENIKVISMPIFYQNLRTPILINPLLFKELSKNDYDIIHSHSDFGLAILARLYSKKHHIPLIHTYHCNYLGYAKSNFGKYSPYIFYIPVKLHTKLLCKTSNRVIVPSFETKRLLKDKFKIKKNVDVIPNGVDLLKFNKENSNINELKKKLRIEKDDFVILSISRLSKEKGIDEIIGLLLNLPNYIKVKLLIVGGGKEEKRLKKLVSKLNLNNVIFTGEVPFDKVQDYYNIGNIFIINSYAETQGLSVIEALASSLPVICPNISLFHELIKNNDNGVLFDNIDELPNIIKMYYDNPKLLVNMREKARESVYDFSLNKMIDNVEKIYEEEISKKYNK